MSTASSAAELAAAAAPGRALTVLHLISHTQLGGRTASALRQARLLAARGHRALVGCVAGSAAAAGAAGLGVPVFAGFQFQRGFRPAALWRDVRRLAALCDAHGVDVVHTHHSAESWVACLAVALARRRPALVRARGVVVPVRPHLFNRWLHNRLTARVVAPSRVIYDQLRTLPGFDPARVALLPDAVDTTRFHPDVDGTAVRREFALGRETPLVVMVARLEPVKGHGVFFAALAELRAQSPHVRALCAGDERTAGTRAATIAAARAAGLAEDALVFTGYRPDVARVLAAADVVVLPSLGSEGSSRVALEAAASGVPVVASAVGCLPEVVEDGVTGLLVPPGDAAALARALAALLADPARARRMGRAARRRAETLYDERLMAERLEALYRAVVAR